MRHPDGLFGWIDCFTLKPELSTQFYCELFGWEATEHPTWVDLHYTQFRKDGRLVAGLSPMPLEMAAEGLTSQWVSYVLVADADAVCERVRAAGGQVMIPPQAVGDEGRLGNVMDPSGGMLGLWEPRTFDGAEMFNEPGSLIWNELHSRQVEAAKDFYADVLGWVWTPGRQSDYAIGTIPAKPGDDKANCGATGMPPLVPEEVPAVWMVYLAVEDCAETVEQARELGGRIFQEPTPNGRMVTAGILEPGGSRFMVASVG